jgi:drug/metabolite transporter (DMT)-like permease
VDETPDAAAPVEPLPQPAQIDGLAPGMTIIRRVRRPPRWPGILACVLAVLMLAATGLGIQVASTGDYTTSTGLAYAAIALSIAAILFGLIAVIRRWARGAGIVGLLVAVLGNPLVLLYVLGSLSGL